MANSFKFKRFEVANERSAMKVGTDGVLLGAWVSLNGDEKHILDVGTGTGVIALMMAQRTEDFDFPSVIVGIDIDSPSVEEAADNIKASPWASRMAAFKCDFAQIKPFPYELIVSNPPYFINALKAPDARRTDARHNDTLAQSQLINSALANLAPQGRLALILPTEEAQLFIDEAIALGLRLCRICRVSTLVGSAPKRCLMEFKRAEASVGEPCIEETLSIQTKTDFTPEYKELTRDFYLKF